MQETTLFPVYEVIVPCSIRNPITYDVCHQSTRMTTNEYDHDKKPEICIVSKKLAEQTLERSIC